MPKILEEKTMIFLKKFNYQFQTARRSGMVGNDHSTSTKVIVSKIG